jgi:hypothetical protein
LIKNFIKKIINKFFFSFLPVKGFSQEADFTRKNCIDVGYALLFFNNKWAASRVAKQVLKLKGVKAMCHACNSFNAFNFCH